MSSPPNPDDRLFNRITGTFGLLGSAAETTVGVFSSEAVVGVPIAAHGVDHLITNAKQIWTGDAQQSVTSRAIANAAEYYGASPQAAQYWGFGLDTTASFASGFAIRNPNLSFETGAAGEDYIRNLYGATKGTPILTSQGLRYPDAVTGTDMTEIKVGYLAYNSRNITQIEKDIEIATRGLGGIDSGDYAFLRSELTGQVGADPRLLEMLENGGLSYTINPGPSLLDAMLTGGATSGLNAIQGYNANNYNLTLSKH